MDAETDDMGYARDMKRIGKSIFTIDNETDSRNSVVHN